MIWWTTATISVLAAVLAAVLALWWRFRRIGYASRETLLGYAQRRYRSVVLAGRRWRIASLTAEEMAMFEGSILASDSSVKVDTLKTAKQRLVAMCLVDEDGRHLCEPEDLDKLDGWIVWRLYDCVRDHCGFVEQDIEVDANTVEALKLMRDFGELERPQKSQHPNQRANQQARALFGGKSRQSRN